ncbi:hypothetical protein LINGRAHAP2_LOCUS31499, partial [Linum grandiflorum]
SSYLHQHLRHHLRRGDGGGAANRRRDFLSLQRSTTAAEARKPPSLRLLPPLRLNLGDGGDYEEAPPPFDSSIRPDFVKSKTEHTRRSSSPARGR